MEAVAAPLLLASRSPQRRAILAQLGVAFEVCAPDVEEFHEGDPPLIAAENAVRKARAVAALAGPERTVIGCDTAVALDGRPYGKPRGEEEARATLAALSGRAHEVVSGLCVVRGSEERTAVSTTRVCFRTLEPVLLDWYVGTGEWRGRAGGYAIQGAGAALVTRLEGDYPNVVGLPVSALLHLLPDLVVRWAQSPKMRAYCP